MKPQEIRDAIAASPELQAMDAQGIAAALSVDSKKLVPTEIGTGSILEVCRDVGVGGGNFLDTLKTIGSQDRDVFWSFDMIQQGRLRIDLAATRAGLVQIKTAVPSIAAEVDAILTLGWVDDPVTAAEVEQAMLPTSPTWTGAVQSTRIENGMVYVAILYTSTSGATKTEQTWGDSLTPAAVAEVITKRVDSLTRADAALALFGG